MKEKPACAPRQPVDIMPLPFPFPFGKKGNAMSSLVVLLLKNYYGHNFLDFSIFQQEKRNRKVNLAIYNSCSVSTGGA